MFQPEWAKKLYYDRIEVFKRDTLRFNQIVFLGIVLQKAVKIGMKNLELLG